MRKLTVATRATDLAMAQTRIVLAKLKTAHPNLEISIETITTTGDKDTATALWDLKDTGFFTSSLEKTLIQKKADFAVHSYKDLPTTQAPGLTVAAVCDRKFPQDCLVASKPITSIRELKIFAKIGTSSLRRAAQLKKLRPDLNILPIRGNVPTRLQKLDQCRYDAVILARAGLERLNLAHKISFTFDPNVFLPAPAQGALAIQARKEDADIIEILSKINEPDAHLTTTAERHILTATGCGCHAPLGAFAKIQQNDIIIKAFISDNNAECFITDSIKGNKIDAIKLADELACKILASGDSEALSKLQK